MAINADTKVLLIKRDKNSLIWTADLSFKFNDVDLQLSKFINFGNYLMVIFLIYLKGNNIKFMVSVRKECFYHYYITMRTSSVIVG